MKKIIALLLTIVYLTVFTKFAFAIPNPASTYCIKNNYKLILVDNTGFCIFSDNSYCEEWRFLKKKCNPGEYFWPETVIDYKKQGKYCTTKTTSENSLIKLCGHKKIKK